MTTSYPDPDLVARIHNFFEQILEEGASFYVILQEGDYIFTTSSEQYQDDDGEAVTVMPLWSEAYLDDAKIFAEGKPLKPIVVDDFLDGLLPDLMDDHTLLGMNWTKDGEGVEFFAEEFLDFFDQIVEDLETEE